MPSEVGKLVNDFLCNNFQNIIDYNFTADVENNFDLIASGKKQWKEIINEFSPIIPLYYDMSVRLKQKNIFGLKNNPLNILDLKTVYKRK